MALANYTSPRLVALLLAAGSPCDDVPALAHYMEHHLSRANEKHRDVSTSAVGTVSAPEATPLLEEGGVPKSQHLSYMGFYARDPNDAKELTRYMIETAKSDEEHKTIIRSSDWTILLQDCTDGRQASQLIQNLLRSRVPHSLVTRLWDLGVSAAAS